MSAGPRRSRAATDLVAVAVLSGLVAVAAWGAQDDLALVSRVSGASGAGANGTSYSASVSNGGRYVAFQSNAANLSGEDADPVYDIFVRDVETNVLTLGSRVTGAGGAGGADNSSAPSISADGRYVAFVSTADNLSTEDNNSYNNIFVRDLQENTTTFVSRASGGAGTAGDDSSYDPAISADGRPVAYYTYADNLSTEDNNTYANVFVRDLATNTTTLVSRAAGATGTGGDESSFLPAISGDGRHIAFQSSANNLSAEDNDVFYNIYVRDVQADAITYVSRANGAAGAAGNHSSFTPSISDSGRYVSFTSDADNLSTEDDNTYLNIFVRDLTGGTTTLASRATGAGGAGANDSADNSSISADGRRVAFGSPADNLSAEDNNAYDNIFVRDLTANTLTLASRATGAAGTAGDDDSSGPALSGNGRYAAFASDANDLSEDDVNTYTNVFLRDIGAPPGGGGGGGGGVIDTTKPRVSRLGMSRKRFKVGKKRTPISAAVKAGTTFRYSLSEESTVRITIERALPGRRARKRSGACRAPTRSRAKNRKCTRYKRSGTLIRKGEGPGRDSTAFSGRIGRKALKPGRYRATLRATDAAGNRSSAKRLRFTVVAP